MSVTTKRALAETFKKLLSKRGLNKITVKDIVEDCGVNRQTFYYHFHDIYELMEWIFQEDLEDIARENLDYDNWSAGMEALICRLQDNRGLILNAYNSINHEVVTRYIRKVLGPYCQAVVEHQAAGMEPPAPEEDIAFVTDLITVTATGLIMDWLGQQMRTKESVIQTLDKIGAAMNGTVELILRNLKGET